MAEIVLLNKWRAEHARKAPVAPRIQLGEEEMAGDVVMFTGVRYERFDDSRDRKAENHAVHAE